MRADPLNPADSGHSAAALIRPKSLAQPGVATRKPSKSTIREDGGSPKTPGTGWKPDMLGNSPLSRLEDLAESAEAGDKRASLLVDALHAAARPITPADLEYSHTGSLRIGSLIITNGVPSSPGPSIADTIRQTIRLSLHEATLDPKGGKLDFAFLDVEPQSKEIFDPSQADASPEEEHVPREFVQPEGYLERSASGTVVRRVARHVLEAPEGDDSPILGALNIPLPKPNHREISPQPSFSKLLRDAAEEVELALQTPTGPPDGSEVDDPLADTVSYIGGADKEVRSSTPMSRHLFAVTPMENHLIPADSYFDSDMNGTLQPGSQNVDPSAVPVKSSSIKSRPSQSKSDSGYSSASGKAPEVDSTRSSWNSPQHQTGLHEAPTNEVKPSIELESHQQIPVTEEPNTREMHRAYTVEPSPDLSYTPSLEHAQTMPSRSSNQEIKAKSWRNSFMRSSLSRLRSNDSIAVQSIESGSSDKNDENSPRPNTSNSSKSAKKLQKRRPFSVQPMTFDQDLDKTIPRIPSGILQRFDERQIQFNGPSTGRYYENNNSRSQVSLKEEQRSSPLEIQRKPSNRFSMIEQSRPSSTIAPPMQQPVQYPEARSPPVPKHQNLQKRLSIKRLSRNPDSRDSLRQHRSEDEDDLNTHVYPHHEYASFGSVAHSLGSSPYDHAMMGTNTTTNNKRNSINGATQHQQKYPGQNGIAIPPPHAMSYTRHHNAPPALPEKSAEQQQQAHLRRPGPSAFRDRHRPKSFHGRGAPPRRMEVLGEEEMEAELDSMPHLSASQAGHLVAIRPMSMNPHQHSIYGKVQYAETEEHPLPQLGKPPMETSTQPTTADWAFHERTWRERRENLANLKMSGGESRATPQHRMSLQQRPSQQLGSSNLPDTLRIGSGSYMANSSQVRQRPHSFMPGLVRNNSRSQPDLRLRKDAAWRSQYGGIVHDAMPMPKKQVGVA